MGVLASILPRLRRAARPSAAQLAAPLPSHFEAELDRQARERHRRIREEAARSDPRRRLVKPYPRGFRCEDFLGIADLEGFLSISEAARRFDLPEEQVLELVLSGAWEARLAGSSVRVRPAVVSVLGVDG